MADDLGARLVQAGLVTPEQLADVRRTAPPHEGALLAALVRRGLDQDAAAGFFVAAGLGPLMDASDLRAAEPGARRRIPGRMARALLALPVRESPAGLVVAMAAPTDRHALGELRRAVDGEILPTAARVMQLEDALERAYPGAGATDASAPESEPPVLELVARKPRADEGYRGSTRGAERVEARALVGPRLAAEDEEGVVPLVRQKPLAPAPAPAPRAKVITKSFELPSERTMAEPRKSGVTSSVPPKSIIPPEHASWDDTSSTSDSVPNKVDPGRLRRISAPPKRPERPTPIGGTLAAIRASRDKGEVVELACRGTLTVCRAAVLLALKKSVLKGWDGAGAGLTRDAVRNVWIPTNSPSMFRDVVARGEPYAGAHGTSAADGLFRAAVGSRGGEVVLMPIAVGGKVVAVLAADDVTFGREGRERVEILARAVGEAFERIIVESKLR